MKPCKSLHTTTFDLRVPKPLSYLFGKKITIEEIMSNSSWACFQFFTLMDYCKFLGAYISTFVEKSHGNSTADMNLHMCEKLGLYDLHKRNVVVRTLVVVAMMARYATVLSSP